MNRNGICWTCDERLYYSGLNTLLVLEGKFAGKKRRGHPRRHGPLIIGYRWRKSKNRPMMKLTDWLRRGTFGEKCDTQTWHKRWHTSELLRTCIDRIIQWMSHCGTKMCFIPHHFNCEEIAWKQSLPIAYAYMLHYKRPLGRLIFYWPGIPSF